MTFECPELSDALKRRIEDHTRRRFSVIDRFLAEQYGVTWLSRPRLIRTEPSHTPRKDLWEFALQANFLLRLYKSVKTDVRPRPEEMTVDAFRFQADGNSLCLLGKSTLVSDDLETAWHPKFHGRKVFPSMDDFDADWHQTCKALSLLAPYPEFINLVRSECGALCFVNSEPAMGDGLCISLTSRMVPGLVYASAAHPILLAESLVHEAAHLQFRAVEEVADLYVDLPDALVVTPLRADPRPPSGFMHQLVVLRHLTALYDKLRISEEDNVLSQRRQVEKRFALHLHDLEAGKRLAKDAEGTLTQEGRRLLECLLECSEPTLL
jgi:hypothetical protein